MELMLKTETFTFTNLSEAEFQTCQTALHPVLVPLEQSMVWGDFNDTVEGREFLGSFRYNDASGKLVALASATLYHERGRDWIWIKHGPVFAQVPNTEVVKKMCATLIQQFAVAKGTKPTFIRLSMPEKVTGLRMPFEHTMYDETVVVQLEKDESEILTGMSQSGRKGLRRAQQAGIEVREVLDDKSAVFTSQCYPILKETGTRDGFGIHPLKLYTSMLNKLPNIARLYVASHEGAIEAWAITTEYNSQAMYYYGGSSSQARETSAAYALHWEIIRLMNQRGNKTYDFMGIAGKHYPALKNVTQFKIKFSKNIVKIANTYDLPLQSVKYRATALALKLKRKLK